ncbi:MAG: hypothetical protein SGPRY_012386 [Prymnesium sp.]
MPSQSQGQSLELEASWKRVGRLKQLLFASQSHVEAYKEAEAEAALEAELQADAAARSRLAAALVEGREEGLKEAIEGMQARGLDWDDAQLDEARLALEALKRPR